MIETRVGSLLEDAAGPIPTSSAWPAIDTYGELDSTEWIHTNGAGAYAMSTVPLMHTRRYHGILVAPLEAPLRRFVSISHAELTLQVGDRQYRLSTHQFPNLAPTPGYRLLRRFAMDPIPRWVYRIGDDEFEPRLCLARGRNIAVMTYTWHGSEPATLTLKPLLPLRRIHDLTHEHGGMVQRVVLRQREVEIQPISDFPPILFRHSGVFVGSPDWWRRFEYLEDRNRAAEFQEDIWTPGTFELTLPPGHTQYLVISVGELPQESARDIMDETIEYLSAQSPGSSRTRAVQVLWAAADAFCVEGNGHTALIAGYPWLGIHLREALTAMEGLCLVRGHLDFAKRMTSCALKLMRGGLLPDVVSEAEARLGKPSPDATLWLFQAARALVDRLGTQDPFVRTTLYPKLSRAFIRLRSRRGRTLIWSTNEGLLANGADDRAVTWMDAQVGQWIVTPRRGLAIEHQALWSKACETMSNLAEAYGDTRLRDLATEACQLARASFQKRFWCSHTEYPFDCVSEERDMQGAWTDATVRPNALIALAIDPELFQSWQAAAIVARVRHDLLTPRGIRTLAPQEPNYQGYHEGGLEQREGSRHQGTVWPHLLGYFVRAASRLASEDDQLRDELREMIESALEEPLALRYVSQIADGDPPHHARGCPAFSTAVAELLRALVVDQEY
jgi:predicted glycogen debranching enzyme